MKVLVTGASGFIGTNLVPRLCERGFSVKTFSRSATVAPEFSYLQVEHQQGDITNSKEVSEAIVGSDTVIHLAGLVSYRKKDAEYQHQVNVVGTRNVMDACLAHGVDRVIHTSSVAAMGIPPAGTYADESFEYNLEGLGLNYCDSKHEAELEAAKAYKNGSPVITLSPGIIFGEGDTHPHHHAIFAAMSKGAFIGIPRGGVPFSDINDVVGAYLNAITKGRIGERYCLVSANLSFLEQAAAFSEVFGVRKPLFKFPPSAVNFVGRICESTLPLFGVKPPITYQVAWLSQHKIFFKSDKAVKELGFEQTPFVETIRRTAPYYLGHVKYSGHLKKDGSVGSRAKC
jgi:dihydroflavonol-4-reductase